MALPLPPPSPSENKKNDNDNDDYCYDCDYSIDVRTTLGKRYSVERYYMLSEIEQNSLDPVYLNDHDNNDNYNDNDNINTIKFPPFVVLYLVWNSANSDSNSDRTESMISFRKGPVRGAIRKLKSLLAASASAEARTSSTRSSTRTASSPSSPRVYVVIDVLVEAKNNNSDDDDDDDESSNTSTRREEHQKLVPIAEQLASSILSDGNGNNNDNVDNDNVSNDNTASRLSPSGIDLAGVTVGLTDHPRAAPGLESCLEAISIGSRDRRKYGSNNRNNDNKKSCVGIVCNSVQDLVGFDEEGETDAVQDLMQSRTDAFVVWQKKTNAIANTKHQKSSVTGEPTTDDTNDKGKRQTAAAVSSSSPLKNFAHEAHRYWRVHKAGLSPEPTPEEKRLHDAEIGLPPNDNGTGNTSSTMLIIAMAIAVASFFWKR